MISEPLRRAVASLPCAKCNVQGYSQAAHANGYTWGKGRGMKSTDAAIFPLCCTRPGVEGCHSRHDQYRDVTKQTRDNVEALYIAKTLVALLEIGLLRVHAL